MSKESSAAILWEIVQRYGTPCYIYDMRRLVEQGDRLRKRLPPAVEIFYSLKANASLGICAVLGQRGFGADVASAGELATAVEAGIPPERIFVAGPYKSSETIGWLRESRAAIVSIDSPSELEQLTAQGLRNRAVLRLRPDFRSGAVVTAGSDSRFGFLLDQLPGCRELIRSSSLDVIGFHIFAGSQVLSAEAVIGHLRGAWDLAQRAAELLDIELGFVNLGGGFGIPYRADDPELDLETIGQELRGLVAKAAPARLALELGRYFVAQSGWYATRVVGYQTHGGRRAVVVDGGTHQRADLCGLCLRTKAAPPVALSSHSPGQTLSGPLVPTDVLGCLSLPSDILAEACLLPELVPGNILAFANAGAYGLWASAINFHGYPPPAEIGFDGKQIRLLRAPQEARRIVDGQLHFGPRETKTKTGRLVAAKSQGTP